MENFNPRSPCGERLTKRVPQLSLSYFNPRSPCGERHGVFLLRNPSRLFQSTLPVWGATVLLLKVLRFLLLFQSTLPVWGATRSRAWADRMLLISIHAPRVGSDPSEANVGLYTDISIHAPRVGSDGNSAKARAARHDFNPRSPCGERPVPVP